MDDYDFDGPEPYEDDLETHELNELARDNEGVDEEPAERRPVFVVVSTARGEGIRLFGIYQSRAALDAMLPQVFGDGATMEPIELRHFPTNVAEGVECGYRVRPADPVVEERRGDVHLVLECYGA